jgi:hypothetical protein
MRILHRLSPQARERRPERQHEEVLPLFFEMESGPALLMETMAETDADAGRKSDWPQHESV